MICHESRIYYVGQVSTVAYGKATQMNLFLGAGSGKMSSVVAALRRAGRRAVLVSLPSLGDSGDDQPGRVLHSDGFPALFLPVRRNSFLRKMIGSLSLAWVAIWRVGRSDSVLFYNHGVEFILALLILRVRGVAVFQDIEDIPTAAEKGVRGFVNRLGYGVMYRLSSARKVTVSDQIGKDLGLLDYLPLHGVACETGTTFDAGKWEQLEAGAPLRIHYGGSLMVDTGLDVFCNAVSELDMTAGMICKEIEFIVTGVGEFNKIREMAASLQSHYLRIEVHEKVEKSIYYDLLNSCHVSLSLKNPESGISNTTFPSKVIEIASHGLALCSTRVSDIGEIFSDESAWLLPILTSKVLANTLKEMVENPEEVRRRACVGQEIARERFSPLAVGQALGEFLERGPKLS